MARKKKAEKEPNLERWLVSYADFITLLFAVFVTLYAMSQTDKKKAEEVVESLRESFGYSKSSPVTKPKIIDSGNINIIPNMRQQTLPPKQAQYGKTRSHAEEKDFKAIKAAIEAYLLKNDAQNKVSVEITRRGLVVSLKEVGFFDSGSATVQQNSYGLLAHVAESVSNYTNPIRVEGHTDNVPISSHTFPSNWELSTARATNLVQYLIRYYEFQPDKISATGFGEHRPIADNSTAEGRGKNRRVDIVLLSTESERGEP
ncbi:OmpA/MotB family protein [Geotalea uraniireducens]|uniref:OmpA/MotB domain protein n=1 Tax=Geotalea uraniireducens (strain Rf4) TaxID=351605 RepID=A5G8V5_GEOUR|nr:flagellar motor protein MotB [Geotalea uraniireducens]ABQ28223.1 OmpA/MotB domain protein [Geotalea uraniireducens Rf4]